MDQKKFTSNHVQDYKAKMCRDTFMLYANNELIYFSFDFLCYTYMI